MRGALVLGHGAGGGFGGRDLQTTRAVALEEGFEVVFVDQPYRVAGRRNVAPTHQLDAAWIAVVEHLALDVPLIAGGRSSGARVACRTAKETGAVAVLCLAFPVHPPGRPEKSRIGELDAVKVPVLVVQGTRDPFGMPPPRRGRTIVQVEADHSLRLDVGDAVRPWLRRRRRTR